MTEVSTPAGAWCRRRRPAAGGGLESVSRLPALAEARRRLLGLCEREAATAGELTEAVEADAGLAIAVMRAANNGSGPSRRTAASVRRSSPWTSTVFARSPPDSTPTICSTILVRGRTATSVFAATPSQSKRRRADRGARAAARAR